MTDSQSQRQHRAISCAECRRLKLRCDRVFPCSSCQKRGCAAICPDGLLPSRKAIRDEISFATSSSSSSTEPLVRRIRDLEHALATLQATYHTTPHPLLRKELRDIAVPSARQRPPPPPSPPIPTTYPPADEVDQLSENLGTLEMTGYGRSRFFGPTGSTWPQIWNIDQKETSKGTGVVAEGSESADSDLCLAALNLPPEILLLISACPSPRPSPAATHIGDWLVENLPPSPEAWSLCETFFENGAYIFMPLCRAMLIEDIFAFFYRPTQKQHVDIPLGHRLALLLMVFAIGDMLDLTKPAVPTGGKRFYYLARAAISLESLYEQPTLTAVQAIVLMTLYLSMSDHKESTETVYVLSGVNLKLALMLGLHRDSLKFTSGQSGGHVPRANEEEMRRVIFHEITHFEMWMSLMSGRPSLLNFEHFDFGPPGLKPERGNAIETIHMKGQAWSYGFIRTCMVPALNFAVAVKPATYSAVLQLDATVRAYPIPQHMEQVAVYEEEGAGPENMSRAAVMLRFSSFSMKEIVLLYIHRPYFACAMMDFVNDPLGSPFSKSVVTSFASACTIIAKISLLFEREPELSVRIWIFWNQLFVPCLILGTIVSRSPSCNLASRALTELDKLCTLLRSASAGYRPSQLLPPVLKISAKAHAAFDLYHSTPGASSSSGTGPGAGAFDVSAELSVLAGKSRVSSPTSTSSSPATQSHPSPTLNSVAVVHTATSSRPNPKPTTVSSFVALEVADAPTTTTTTTTTSIGNVDNSVFSSPSGGWSSFADFEAFAEGFALQSSQPPSSGSPMDGQLPLHPHSQPHPHPHPHPQAPAHSPDLIPQQTYNYLSMANASSEASHSLGGWEGGGDNVFDRTPTHGQAYPLNLEQAQCPALEMQPTWQHFMTQMFGNSMVS